MATVSELNLINKIATYEGEISGITRSYSAGENPNRVDESILPCVLHFSPGFSSEPRAHHNKWGSEITVQSALLVVPRQTKGADLSLIETQTIPFGYLFRQKMQTNAVINDFLSLGLTAFSSFKGSYGVGNGVDALSFGGKAYFGWVFTYVFTEI